MSDDAALEVAPLMTAYGGVVGAPRGIGPTRIPRPQRMYLRFGEFGSATQRGGAVSDP